MEGRGRSVGRPVGRPATVEGRFTDSYLWACRAIRLRRWPDRPGREALRLQRGDIYAWWEGPATARGTIHVAMISEPRTVFIADDEVWWVPRLDQLLDGLEAAVRRREPDPRRAREWIALRLAERVRKRDWSWEEAALDLLMAQP
jgi:hypothetical protein